MTDHAQTMLELADKLERWPNVHLQPEENLRVVAALRAHPAIGTPDNAREALGDIAGFSITPDTGYSVAQAMRRTAQQALTAIPREQEAKPVASDRCARCRHPRAEHSYNGACYGLCGNFVAPPSDSPGSAHQPQGGSFSERAIKLIREAAGHQDDWGKYEYAVIDLAREADSAHQYQGGDAREEPPVVTRYQWDGESDLPIRELARRLSWVMIQIEGSQFGLPRGSMKVLAQACRVLATPPAPVRAAAEPINSLGKCLDLIDDWDRHGSIDHSLAFELHTKLKKVWTTLTSSVAAVEPGELEEATQAQHFDLPKGQPARFVRNGILEICQCRDCAALSPASANEGETNGK